MMSTNPEKTNWSGVDTCDMASSLHSKAPDPNRLLRALKSSAPASDPKLAPLIGPFNGWHGRGRVGCITADITVQTDAATHPRR